MRVMPTVAYTRVAGGDGVLWIDLAVLHGSILVWVALAEAVWDTASKSGDGEARILRDPWIISQPNLCEASNVLESTAS
jgi:hypothetical protein